MFSTLVMLSLYLSFFSGSSDGAIKIDADVFESAYGKKSDGMSRCVLLFYHYEPIRAAIFDEFLTSDGVPEVIERFETYGDCILTDDAL